MAAAMRRFTLSIARKRGGINVCVRAEPELRRKSRETLIPNDRQSFFTGVRGGESLRPVGMIHADNSMNSRRILGNRQRRSPKRCRDEYYKSCSSFVDHCVFSTKLRNMKTTSF